MNKKRGHWYLLTGLLLGALIGYLISSFVWPVEYVDTNPAALSPEEKDRFRALIAAAYQANGDIVRAKARLELLGDPDLNRALADQAQRTLAGGKAPDEARSLGLLAVSLGQGPVTPPPPTILPASTATRLPPTASSPMSLESPTLTASPTAIAAQLTLTSAFTSTTPSTSTLPVPPVTPVQGTIAPTVVARPQTGTPPPSPTPTITPGAPFVLSKQEKVCDPKIGQSQLQLQAFDSADQAVPGLEAIVTWGNNEAHFFTGLKPELGLGYGDFTISSGITYTLRLAEGGQPVTGLLAFECPNDSGKPYPGSWKLIFTQP